MVPLVCIFSLWKSESTLNSLKRNFLKASSVEEPTKGYPYFFCYRGALISFTADELSCKDKEIGKMLCIVVITVYGYLCAGIALGNE